VLYYQSCGVKVSKTKVERLSGVGVWPANPSESNVTLGWLTEIEQSSI
jgi:hypothetical protein